MPEENQGLPFPYNLPIFRGSHAAAYPDGRFMAEIGPAHEAGMGGPTSGTLRLSNGIRIEGCNPSFVWSDDSKYLAVPAWKRGFGVLQGQQILVIDVAAGQVYRSPWYWNILQPASFVSGLLAVDYRPHYNPKMLQWRVPEDLGSFARSPAPLSDQAE